MSRFIQPLPVALLALLLSVASSTFMVWKKTEALAVHILATRKEAAAKLATEDHDRRAQGWDFWTIEMENLTNELEEEKAKVRQKSDELDQRAARMDAERQELDRVRSDIESMQAEIDQRVIAIHEDETKNLHKLAQLYSTIDPTSAVAIIREMDDTQAVKILSLMKADVTAAIFEEMAKATQPDGTTLAKRAAMLSEKLRLVKDTPVAASP